MRTWTRTLNLDDTHALLALATPGCSFQAWAEACEEEIPELSQARRREQVRLVRDHFLELDDDDRIGHGLFLDTYLTAPATAQLELVRVGWALSHPLTRVAVDELVAPALEAGSPKIPLSDVEALVAERIHSRSRESLRKTRTVLLGAMEGIGTLVTRGTGQHRFLRAARGAPHPLVFAYLVLHDLRERRMDAMMAAEVTESSLAPRLTQCTPSHAAACLEHNLAAGILEARDDEIGVPRDR